MPESKLKEINKARKLLDEGKPEDALEFINKLELNGAQVTQVEGSIYTHEEINTAIGAENETLITVPLKQF